MRRILILLILLIPVTQESNRYEKSKETFFNRNVSYDECSGLESFCYRGFMRCRVDCNLMAKDCCVPYKMPAMLHNDELITCKE